MLAAYDSLHLPLRSDSKVDDGLDNIQLDLTNLRQRFENGNQSSEEISRPSSKAERNQLQRSESILAKVQRYQSLASGEKMANSDGESGSNSVHNSDTESDHVKEDLNQKEKVSFNGLSAIKSQFENGSLNNGNSSEDAQSNGGQSTGGRDEETKNELFKLRQRMCLGRSASMKQVYESQTTAGSTPATVNSKSTNSSSAERQRVLANTLKEKFEKGDFTTENELEFKERLRKEVSEELNVVHEADTAAKDAKNKFKQLEKSNSFQAKSSTNSLTTNSTNVTPRTTPLHHPKVNTYSKKADTQIEVVKCSEPGEKEEFHINVNQLQERYRFFEQQQTSNPTEEKPSKPTDTPRRPIQIPKAIDDCVVETPNDQIKRDPNIIRSSDVIDDLPKNDIAKKMLNVFQQLEKSNSITNVTKELNGTPNRDRPPVRCITPPKDYSVESNDEVDAPPVNGDIVRSSYKDEEIIPVEPEKAKNLKAMFENWGADVEKENRKNSNLTESLEELPHNGDFTKSLRSKFESIRDDKTDEKSPKLKVNRFVQEELQVTD